MPIDATLDLHGYKRDNAHQSLLHFIDDHYRQGSRCLLVVTGKGIKSSSLQPSVGILRESLPVWLADTRLRPMVLAYDVAKPKHGGSGAFYILLRRKR
jgi:DNA-nicking Smr family endonuclease